MSPLNLPCIKQTAKLSSQALEVLLSGISLCQVKALETFSAGWDISPITSQMRQVNKDQVNPEVAQVAGIQAIFSQELTCVECLLAWSPCHLPILTAAKATRWQARGQAPPGAGHPAQ